MQATQTTPADALAGFAFLHSIGHEIVHGTDINSFRFTELSNGGFMGECDGRHTSGVVSCGALTRLRSTGIYPHLG